MLTSVEYGVVQRWIEDVDPAFIFLLMIPFVVAVVGVTVELYERRKAAEGATKTARPKGAEAFKDRVHA